jgi:acyl carrier protein
MTAEEKINQVICEKLGIDNSLIVPDANFVDDLGADSLDLVELIMSLEEMAMIDIPDSEAEKITTVQSAYDYIKKAVGEKRWSAFDGD